MARGEIPHFCTCKMYSLGVKALLALFLCFIITAQQDCLRASNGDRPLPNFVRPGGIGEPRFEVWPLQAIITSYRFNCCGVVTEWRAFVEGSGGGHFENQPYIISFQVWRPNSPSPVDTDGCYNMTGVNRFSPIPLADDKSADRGIVTGTVPESERIEVQPGDVVGFYLESSRSDDDGIQFAGDVDNDPAYTSEDVWYATGTINSGPAECQLPVGSGRTLSLSTNRAPLLTVSVVSSECPSSTPQPTTETLSPTSPSHSLTPSHNSPTSVSHSLTPSHQSPTPTSEVTSSPEPAPVNPGLYVGIAVPVLLLVVGVVIALVSLYCVAAKKKKKQQTSQMLGKRALQTGADVTKDDPVSVENEAYQESKQPMYSYIDPPSDPVILSSQNPAYGEVLTRAEDDYYINEGMGGAAEVRMTGNEAYVTSRQPSSNTDPSIPTTENQAYTNVSANTENQAYASASANTERAEDEETYDYVREL